VPAGVVVEDALNILLFRRVARHSDVMPRMDGYEFVRRLRQTLTGNPVPGCADRISQR